MKDRPTTRRNDKLRKLRIAKGWTKQQLATAAQVSAQTIRKAERGQKISEALMGRIANALGVSFDKVFGKLP